MSDDRLHDWPAFFDRLVHDLREPLRSIQSFSELLRDAGKEGLGSDCDFALGEILSSSDNMRILIDGLSQFGPALSPHPTPDEASLQLAFDMATLTFDREIAASGASITGEGLPRVAVGLERLNFLLENLLGNALRFRGDAVPAICVTAESQNGPATDWWVVRVEDNGIGIAAKDQEAVFRPFARVYGRKYPGAGLGLTACQNIVESHGGRIWIESAPSGGCICAFTLPAAAGGA